MNKTSWIFVIVTTVIIGLIGFFYLRPIVASCLQIYLNTQTAKKDLTDASKKKEVLENLTKNNQLTNLYDIASKYIPESSNSGELVIELTAMATQSNLSVGQVSLEDKKDTKTGGEETSGTSTDNKAETNATSSASSPSGTNEVNFSLKVNGTFPDFVNFLKNTETSSRLISITSMILAQEQDKFTAQLVGKAFWQKGASLENILANIEISQETINKFQNLKTYGTPINLPTESGFGRTDPFVGY
ncbi:hypothetical protein A2V71_01755 [Candidatus Berkelbacteria bacterium RBG_13_40_8]|uniref:Uncharacterized protein n=1 Tax=Candidatus Berkelbacteria bacterium RBG_13_40_8 TaxID=1797467 RepID=A0A1F5DQ22_9BACT|nr:MAG: hypothetical protein A2V71_01755 [Candidatus Berkelbacteria bacterium RBG_13_40_8]